MKGQYFDGKGRVYGVMQDGERYCTGRFDRTYGYQRIDSDDLPLRATEQEAQEDLDYYAYEHELRMTDVYAVRYSVHEGPTAETLKLFDAASGTRVTFGLSQLAEPGVVYLSNYIPGAVDVPGIGKAASTFYLVGEGIESGEYRDLSPKNQARWLEILAEAHEKYRREIA